MTERELAELEESIASWATYIAKLETERERLVAIGAAWWEVGRIEREIDALETWKAYLEGARGGDAHS